MRLPLPDVCLTARPSAGSGNMAKHHPDLIMCRKQPGIGENVSPSTCTTSCCCFCRIFLLGQAVYNKTLFSAHNAHEMDIDSSCVLQLLGASAINVRLLTSCTAAAGGCKPRLPPTCMRCGVSNIFYDNSGSFSIMLGAESSTSSSSHYVVAEQLLIWVQALQGTMTSDQDEQ